MMDKKKPSKQTLSNARIRNLKLLTAKTALKAEIAALQCDIANERDHALLKYLRNQLKLQRKVLIGVSLEINKLYI